MNEDTGYRCSGCGTPTSFGSTLCGGGKCFNMAAETGQGWDSDRPRRSPSLERGSSRRFEERLSKLGQAELPKASGGE